MDMYVQCIAVQMHVGALHARACVLVCACMCVHVCVYVFMLVEYVQVCAVPLECLHISMHACV